MVFVDGGNEEYDMNSSSKWRSNIVAHFVLFVFMNVFQPDTMFSCFVKRTKLREVNL